MTRGGTLNTERKRAGKTTAGQERSSTHQAQTEKATYRTNDANNLSHLMIAMLASAVRVYQGKVTTQGCRTYKVYFRSNFRLYLQNTTYTGRLKVRCYECTPLLPPWGH